MFYNKRCLLVPHVAEVICVCYYLCNPCTIKWYDTTC